MKTKTLLKKLAKYFPKSLAESYDHVGLQCGKIKEETNTILLCLDYDEEVFRKESIIQLYSILSRMEEGREKYIIIRRYGLYGNREMTQREIAAELGISRSYVSRIEKKALNYLKKQFEKMWNS